MEEDDTSSQKFPSRSPDAAYKYLPESVLAFPDYEALCERMTHADRR